MKIALPPYPQDRGRKFSFIQLLELECELEGG